MALQVTTVPPPAAGADWQVAVPGQYVWEIRSIVATLAADTGCSVVPSGTALDTGSTVGGLYAGRVDLPAGAFDPGNGPFTIELWMRATPASATVATDVCALGPGLPAGFQAVEFTPRVGALIGLGSGYPSSFTGLVQSQAGAGDEWVYYVVTVTGPSGTFTISENAVDLQSGPTGAYTFPAFSASVLGGRFEPAPTTFTSAEIAHVALYHSVLSFAQRAAHYAAMCADASIYPAAVLADNPISYYECADAFGSLTATDNSGNGNDGTIADSPVFGVTGVTRGSGTSARNTALEVTDGTNVVLLAPALVGQTEPAAVTYTWYVAGSLAEPALFTVAVEIPQLIMPAGWTLGSRTSPIAPADQWSNITVWWNDEYSGGNGVLTPYAYTSLLLLWARTPAIR